MFARPTVINHFSVEQRYTREKCQGRYVVANRVENGEPPLVETPFVHRIIIYTAVLRSPLLFEIKGIKTEIL